MVPDHETYAYSASKAGLHHLSRAMGGRLGWEGITSNTIACGQYFSLHRPNLTVPNPSVFQDRSRAKVRSRLDDTSHTPGVLTDPFVIQ